MRKETMYIDDQTGEIVGQKSRYVGNRFDPEKGYLFRNQAGGFSQFYDVSFPPGMTDMEIGRMTRLAKKMYGKTNLIGYRGNGGIRPYDIDGMARIIGLERRQTYNFIKKMINLGVMAKVKVESRGRVDYQFYINPLYYNSSNRIPLNLYLLFRQQLDPYIPIWARKKFLDMAGVRGSDTK
jgi:hypothetical protein